MHRLLGLLLFFLLPFQVFAGEGDPPFQESFQIIDCSFLMSGKTSPYLLAIVQYDQKQSEKLIRLADVLFKYNEPGDQAFVEEILKNEDWVGQNEHGYFYDEGLFSLRVNDALNSTLLNPLLNRDDLRQKITNLRNLVSRLSEERVFSIVYPLSEGWEELNGLLPQLDEENFYNLVDENGALLEHAEAEDSLQFANYTKAKNAFHRSLKELVSNYAVYIKELNTTIKALFILKSHKPDYFHQSPYSEILSATIAKYLLFYELLADDFRKQIVYRAERFPIASAAFDQRVDEAIKWINALDIFPTQEDRTFFEILKLLGGEVGLAERLKEVEGLRLLP